jgi:hypothetical protein
MSTKHQSKRVRAAQPSHPAHSSLPAPAAESLAPYGAEVRRPRWVLALWIVLWAAWLIFLLIFVVRQFQRS